MGKMKNRYGISGRKGINKTEKSEHTFLCRALQIEEKSIKAMLFSYIRNTNKEIWLQNDIIWH